MEQSWIDMVLQRDRGSQVATSRTTRTASASGPTRRSPTPSPRYDAVARRDRGGRRRRSPTSTTRCPVPKGVPWFPDDIEAWSVRWVLLHLIEEIARHAGHADIVRESIDGATMYELMAAAEGWPATDWLQPWAPAS